jgi:DNA helicase-2/ATP-dependent DNA helicase PcrA
VPLDVVVTPEPRGPNVLLDDLSPAQLQAVTTDAMPACVVAAAGTGKTRVLTRRIAYRIAAGSARAPNVLALTFTRKAATELQDRLNKLGLPQPVAAGTFHSMAAAALRQRWADRRQRAPVLLERKSRLLAPLAAGRKRLAGVPIGELASIVDWAQARMVAPEDLEAALSQAGRSAARSLRSVSAGDLAALYARYEHEKRRRGLVDFDDLLLRCAEAIENDASFGASQRWRWRHIFVDEFQDLNPLQFRLLQAWMGPSLDLYVVGDPDQAIYGWNGADPSLFDRVRELWPSTVVLRLEDNHRCSPQVLAVARAALDADVRRLRSACPDGPIPSVRCLPTEHAEAAAIASAIRRAHQDGISWNDIAVLTRTNAQLIPIREALEAAGIPVWMPLQDRLLDDPAVRSILKRIGREGRRPLQAVMAELAELGPDTDDGILAAASALMDLARAYRRQAHAASATQWLSWLKANAGEPAFDEAGFRAAGGGGRPPASEPARAAVAGVALCSFHRAKGLEWDMVWVAGLEAGLVPLGRDLSAEQEAEERRALYVALTRAARHLHCSWARQRSFGGAPAPRAPSPWLPGADSPLTSAVGASGEARSAGADPPADPALVGALHAWRARAALSAGMASNSVLHESTLNSVASRKPLTMEELLEVPGMGLVKAARYGEELLGICASAISPAAFERYH